MAATIINFGITGMWVTMGLRVENPIEFSIFHCENGCLDAPEVMYAGSVYRTVNGHGEEIVHGTVFHRGNEEGLV